MGGIGADQNVFVTRLRVGMFPIPFRQATDELVRIAFGAVLMTLHAVICRTVHGDGWQNQHIGCNKYNHTGKYTDRRMPDFVAASAKLLWQTIVFHIGLPF